MAELYSILRKVLHYATEVFFVDIHLHIDIHLIKVVRFVLLKGAPSIVFVGRSIIILV